MTVEIHQVGNEPIIIATIFEPVDMSVDPIRNRDESNAIARKFTGKVYRITDFTHFELTFAQLVAGLAEDIKHSEPNIVHILVGSGHLVELQRDALKQKQYGGREAHIFASQEEALTFARNQIKGG